jgi:hypothetical protein
VLLPHAARGEPRQQLPPLPRRPERPLQRLPRAENALAIVIGSSIWIRIGA